MQTQKRKKFKKEAYECCCPCHSDGEAHTHPTQVCTCGKPVKPRQHCPPQPETCQPGVVNLPQDEPVPAPPLTPNLPGSDKHPPTGDPNEIPWFRGEINRVRSKGPNFGPRKDEFLPFLLMRAASGDRGGRPINGVFWESPDIFVVPGQEAETAPFYPATAGGVARANQPNTLYAHVWNLGKAPSFRVRVEFYWFNPSLGFSSANAHLIGAAYVDLANRFTLYDRWMEVNKSESRYLTRGCHAIVLCPVTWVPTFENNGHECLVVRASEPMLDPAPRNVFSPVNDRHTGQRNIAVVEAASPASIDLALDLGYPDQSGEAVVEVERLDPESMEWLKLFANSQRPGFTPISSPVAAGFLPPTPVGSRLPRIENLPFESRQELLRLSERFPRGCDPLKVTFHASVKDIDPNQAQVLRIRQKVDGDVVGGYTVVLLKLGPPL